MAPAQSTALWPETPAVPHSLDRLCQLPPCVGRDSRASEQMWVFTCQTLGRPGSLPQHPEEALKQGIAFGFFKSIIRGGST